MIVYLFDPNKTDIAAFLNQSGVELWQKPQDSGNIEAWDQMGMNPLEKVGAIVLEVSSIDQQTNYLLAQAILLQKDTLCLYNKAKPPRQLLMYLGKKNVPKCIQTKAYTEKGLQGLVQKFIKTVKPDVEIDEAPNIKYTLRITSSIEKYLNWKSRQDKINKADFIRDNISKQMRKDEEYRKWLKKNI